MSVFCDNITECRHRTMEDIVDLTRKSRGLKLPYVVVCLNAYKIINNLLHNLFNI